MVRYPPLLLRSHTHAHLCDAPFCNISRDNFATRHKSKARNTYVILSLQASRDMKSIASGPLRNQRGEIHPKKHPKQKVGPCYLQLGPFYSRLVFLPVVCFGLSCLRLKFGSVFFAFGGNSVWSFLLTVSPRPDIGFGLLFLTAPPP